MKQYFFLNFWCLTSPATVQRMPGTFEPLSEVPRWATGKTNALPLSTQQCQGKGAAGKLFFPSSFLMTSPKHLLSSRTVTWAHCLVFYNVGNYLTIGVPWPSLNVWITGKQKKKRSKFWINKMGEVNWPCCSAVGTIGTHAFAKQKDKMLVCFLSFCFLNSEIITVTIDAAFQIFTVAFDDWKGDYRWCVWSIRAFWSL